MNLPVSDRCEFASVGPTCEDRALRRATRSGGTDLGRADLSGWRRQARYWRQMMKRCGQDNAATRRDASLAGGDLSGWRRQARYRRTRALPLRRATVSCRGSIPLRFGQAAAAQLGQQDHESTAAAGGSIQRRLVRSQAHARPHARTHMHTHTHVRTRTHHHHRYTHTQTSQPTTPHTTPHHAHTHTLTHTIVRVLQGPGE